MQLHYSALLPTWLGLSNVVPLNAQSLEDILLDPANEWDSSTTISFPGSQEFTSATQRWTVYAPPTYAAAVSPGVEGDVVKSVQVATTNNISLLATGGRHGYTTTLSQLQGGIAIDLSNFKSIEIDSEAETLTIGGGVKPGEIYDPIFDAGFELQTGTSQCPGLLGLTLGGGVGRDGGRYGLVLDALQSVRLVTADAKLIEVSAWSNPDLFWAIRGAGANFGIVTSATYKLNKIADVSGYEGQVTSVDVIFPAQMSATYFDTVVKAYGTGSLPSNLAATNIVLYDFENEVPYLAANWAFFGPEAEARAVLAPILDLGPAMTLLNVVPWNLLANTALLGTDPANCAGNRSQSIYGVNMRQLSASTYQTAFEKMSQFYIDHPEGRQAMLALEMFPNQAAQAVQDDATAYPWRDTVAHLLILLIEAGDAGDKLGLELRDDFVATSGYPEHAVYVNYAHGDEQLHQVYGKSLPRLSKLKSIWDPNNVFGFGIALPTDHS